MTLACRSMEMKTCSSLFFLQESLRRVLCVSAVRFYNSAKLRAMLAALNRSLRKAEVSNRA